MDVALHGPSGRTLLGPSVLTIGRAQSNQLVINDPKASSRHAEIHPAGQGYTIIDLGSMNGTFVNDQRLNSGTPRQLNQGDAIRIGDTTLTYIVSGAQGMGIPTSDGSTVRADYGYQAPAQPPSHTGYGAGAPGVPGAPNAQRAYPGQSLTPPYAYPPVPPLSTSPVDSDGTLLPAQPAQPYVQPMPMGASGMVTPPRVQQPYPQPIGSVPSGPPEKKRSGISAMAIILIVLALIVIIASAGIFFVVHNNQVATSNSNATATAQTSHNDVTATVRAQQNATATAFASVHLTATAQATSHYPPFTNPVLNDSMTSTSPDWQSSSTCQFVSAGYQVSIAQVNTFQYCLNSGTFGDFAYQVTMTIQQGDCGGLIFRHINNSNFYLFEVCQSGTYNIGDFLNNQVSTLYPTPRANSQIQQGLNKQNVIAITVQADTVNMYVNGKNIDTATSKALTSTTFSQGGFGLIGADATNPTAVTYTNALVWTTS